MLPKEKRLANTRDFKRVYQKGSFFSARLINLNLLSNKLSISRLGIVVTKKLSKKATDRNKIKRRLREVSKEFYNLLPAGYDVILTAKEGIKDVKFEEIQKEIKEVFEKAGK